MPVMKPTGPSPLSILGDGISNAGNLIAQIMSAQQAQAAADQAAAQRTRMQTEAQLQAARIQRDSIREGKAVDEQHRQAEAIEGKYGRYGELYRDDWYNGLSPAEQKAHDYFVDLNQYSEAGREALTKPYMVEETVTQEDGTTKTVRHNISFNELLASAENFNTETGLSETQAERQVTLDVAKMSSDTQIYMADLSASNRIEVLNLQNDYTTLRDATLFSNRLTEIDEIFQDETALAEMETERLKWLAEYERESTEMFTRMGMDFDLEMFQENADLQTMLQDARIMADQGMNSAQIAARMTEQLSAQSHQINLANVQGGIQWMILNEELKAGKDAMRFDRDNQIDDARMVRLEEEAAALSRVNSSDPEYNPGAVAAFEKRVLGLVEGGRLHASDGASLLGTANIVDPVLREGFIQMGQGTRLNEISIKLAGTELAIARGTEAEMRAEYIRQAEIHNLSLQDREIALLQQGWYDPNDTELLNRVAGMARFGGSVEAVKKYATQQFRNQEIIGNTEATMASVGLATARTEEATARFTLEQLTSMSPFQNTAYVSTEIRNGIAVGDTFLLDYIEEIQMNPGAYPENLVEIANSFSGDQIQEMRDEAADVDLTTEQLRESARDEARLGIKQLENEIRAGNVDIARGELGVFEDTATLIDNLSSRLTDPADVDLLLRDMDSETILRLSGNTADLSQLSTAEYNAALQEATVKVRSRMLASQSFHAGLAENEKNWQGLELLLGNPVNDEGGLWMQSVRDLVENGDLLPPEIVDGWLAGVEQTIGRSDQMYLLGVYKTQAEIALLGAQAGAQSRANRGSTSGGSGGVGGFNFNEVFDNYASAVTRVNALKDDKNSEINRIESNLADPDAWLTPDMAANRGIDPTGATFTTDVNGDRVIDEQDINIAREQQQQRLSVLRQDLQAAERAEMDGVNTMANMLNTVIPGSLSNVESMASVVSQVVTQARQDLINGNIDPDSAAGQSLLRQAGDQAAELYPTLGGTGIRNRYNTPVDITTTAEADIIQDVPFAVQEEPPGPPPGFGPLASPLIRGIGSWIQGTGEDNE